MASKAIRGITVEIGGDTTKLGKVLEGSEKSTRSLQGELREVEKLLQFDPENTELLAQKQKILTDAVGETTNKLKTLKEAEEQVVKQFEKGEIGEDQLRAFQREIVKTENELDGFNDKLDGTEDNFKDVGDSAEDSTGGFTIMKGALADLVSNAISSAISAIGDFIGSLMELSEATEEYRTMQAKLEGSANTFGYSVDFANSKYQEFYKYLGDDQAATNAITNLLGVGTSTESLSKLVEGATGAWATYGDSINIESLTEAINETITCGKVTGSFADTINWCKESNEGLKTALGGNKDALKAYNDALNEGLPVEDAFNEALKKITDEQERADVVAQFLNSTYGESKKAYDEVNKSVMDANESELALKDTQAQLGETMAPVNNALTDMKNQALQAIAPLVESLANAFMNLYHWLQENPTVMKILTAVAIALTTAFTILAGVLAIQGIIKGVTIAFQFLNTTLLANPIVLIIAAIAGLVAAFIYLWNNCEGFRNFFINMWEGIKAGVNAVIEWFKSIPEKIKNIFDKVINFFKENWKYILGFLINPFGTAFKLLYDKCEGFRNFINNFIQKIKNIVNSVINWFKNFPENIGYIIGLAIGHIIKFGQNIWNFFTVKIPQYITTAINWFKTLPGKIWSAIVTAVTNIGTWASNMKNKAVSGVTSLVNSVVSWFKSLPGKIKSAISSAVTAIGTWCTNMKTKASNGIKNVVSSVVNGFKSLPSKLLNVGKNIVEGLWNGIKNAKDWLIGKIKSFAKGITSGIKAALGIKSPSRVMRDEVGRYIAEGIGAGITANANNPLNALKKLGDDMANQDINLNGATINRKLATTFAVDGGAVSMDEAILNKLDTLADKISRLKMVLNNGALVGELIDDIDAGLADKQLLSIRGV